MSFTPLSFNDIKGNYGQICKIKTFIQNFYKKKNKLNLNDKVLLIIGPSGCGKTSLSSVIFKEYNLNPITITDMSARNIKNHILNSINHISIDEFLSPRKKVLFIDDIDILERIDKVTYSTINSLLKNIHVPVIFTCTKSGEKRLSDLKKKAQVIYMNKTSYKENVEIILEINKNEKYNFENLLTFLKNNNNNINHVIRHLDEFTTGYKNNVSDKDLYNSSSVYDICEKLLNKNISIDSFNTIVSDCEIGIVIQLMHENVIPLIKSDSNINSVIQLYENMRIGEQFEKKAIYNTSDYSIYEISMLLRLFTFHITPFTKTCDNMKYTSLFTKSATRSNNKKKIQGILNKFDVPLQNVNVQRFLTMMNNVEKNENLEKNELNFIKKIHK